MNITSAEMIKAGRNGGSAHKHRWIDSERDIIRREYDGTGLATHRIVAKLTEMIGEKITFFAVKGQAAKMGIMQDKSPDWTEKEIENLSEMITTYSPMFIAKRLHRSVNAVVVKSKRLGLSRRARDGWFTKKEVCEIMGVDHKKIQVYIDSGNLNAEWNNPELKPCQNGMAYWRIKQPDLIDFIKKYGGDFQGRNVDLVMIVWLLCGDI